MIMTKTEMAAQNTQTLVEVSQQTVYLMGASFILGSLITVLTLLALDFVRRHKASSGA
jgi:hypothetical protein